MLLCLVYYVLPSGLNFINSRHHLLVPNCWCLFLLIVHINQSTIFVLIVTLCPNILVFRLTLLICCNLLVAVVALESRTFTVAIQLCKQVLYPNSRIIPFSVHFWLFFFIVLSNICRVGLDYLLSVRSDVKVQVPRMLIALKYDIGRVHRIFRITYSWKCSLYDWD